MVKAAERGVFVKMSIQIKYLNHTFTVPVRVPVRVTVTLMVKVTITVMVTVTLM